MSALGRMLIRDLATLAVQALSIAMVIAAGTAAFIATMSTHHSLTQARDDYYTRTRFADMFVRLHRAPLPVAEQLRDLPGVGALHAGLSFAGRVSIDGVPDLLSARLLDLPSNDEVNSLTILAGRWPDHGSTEVLLGETFAERRGLRPGDTLRAVMNGREQILVIAGIAASPEFLIGVSEGAMADDRSLAIIWMDRDRLAAAFDMRAAFNTLAIRNSAQAATASLKRQLDILLKPYGSRGATTRNEQPSHRALTQEINEQRVFAVVLPTVFLAIALFILNVVLTRLVGTQRDRIATLKALGYPAMRIAGHYLVLAALVALAGNLVGIMTGKFLGAWMTGLFTGIFRIPGATHQVAPWIAFLPIAISFAAALGASLLAVREVLRLSAAEAMRPPAPATYRHALSPSRRWVKRVPAATRMIARSIARRPIRAALTVLGISGAVAILVAGTWWRDAFDRMISLHFGVAMPADMHVGVAKDLPPRAIHDLRRLPGVLQVETRQAVPVRFISIQHSERGVLETLSDSPRLRQPINEVGEPVQPPAAGLMLSARLAGKLGVGPGDTVQVEFLDGRQREQTLGIGAVFDEPMGRSAFISARELRESTGEPESVNVVSFRVSRQDESDLIAELKNIPAITGAFVKHALVEHIRSNTERNLLVFTGVLSVFAAAIAAGVVYNSARIALAERRWELATLRVLGMREDEVGRLLLGELMLQALLAIPAGCIGGWLLAWLLVSMMNSENFTIPLNILPRTYVWAVSVMLATGAVSAVAVRRRLGRLDLIEVLKTRE